MPIKYPPYSGQFLICDYRGFVEPEMVKRRPVIVISPRDRLGYNLVHVIPLSTTAPIPVQSHHITIAMPPRLVGREIGEMVIAEFSWAKCDLINTVSFSRLELIPIGRNAAGDRIYSSDRVPNDVLTNLRKSAAKRMGIAIDN